MNHDIPFLTCSPKTGVYGYRRDIAPQHRYLFPKDKNRDRITEHSKKSDYKKAEREYLLEAKSLAAVAFQSFEEARKLKGDDQKYKDALAKANQEKAKVDELLAKAREMKELNEKNSMGP